MKNLFGLTLTLLGLLTLAFGLNSIFGANAQTRYLILGAVLVPVGGIVAFLGGILTAQWGVSASSIEGRKTPPPANSRLRLSKLLFTLCFLAAVGVAIAGLWSIFDGWVYVYLLIIGLLGTLPSALAAIALE